jgi:metallophosphoesterase superfamily enzyme
MFKQSTLFVQPEIRFMKNSLLIKNEILVIGDLHFGYEDEIVREGVIPNIQLQEVFDDLKDIFSKLEKEKIKLKEIVLLGDLKQEFGVISDNEWRDVSKLLSVLEKKCEKLIIIKGNHDIKLRPIVRKMGLDNIELKDYYKITIKSYFDNYENKTRGGCKKIKNNERNIWFLHGDKVFKQVFGQDLNKQKSEEFRQMIRQMFRQTNRQTSKKDILVLGHLHPAISLSDEYKKEKYKCFLYGNWKGFVVYILPSFSSISFGYDIRNLSNKSKSVGSDKTGKGIKKIGKKIGKHDFFIIDDKDLRKFNVVIYNDKSDEVFDFGKLDKLIE